MKTVDEIEYDRAGTLWGALCLFVLMLFGAIFFGSLSLYMCALEQTKGSFEFLLCPLTGVFIIICMRPGVFVWKLLRKGKHGRYAALYGFIIISVVIITVPILLVVPFASHPEQ